MEDVTILPDSTMNTSTVNLPTDLRVLAQSYLAFKIGKYSYLSSFSYCFFPLEPIYIQRQRRVCDIAAMLLPNLSQSNFRVAAKLVTVTVTNAQ